jgi:CPA2 family monovalent cation:H+ antiporter-2
LRGSGYAFVEGNAASRGVMARAGIGEARELLVAIPNAFEGGRAAAHAKEANPGIRIIARAHADAEVAHLERQGADVVIMGERQIALEMISASGVTLRPGSS